MKKIVILFLVVSLPYVLLSQVLSGHIKGRYNGTKAYLYTFPLLDGKRLSVDSTDIVDGRFVFKYKVGEEPLRGKLILKESRLLDEGSFPILQKQMDMFLANDSTIVLAEDSLKDIQVVNSVINYESELLNDVTAFGWAQYVNVNGKILTQIRALPSEILNTMEYQGFVKKRFEFARAELYKAYEYFISTNPSSWVSLYAMGKRLTKDNNPDAKKMLQLFSGLDQHIKESPSGRELSRKLEVLNLVSIGSTAPSFKLPNTSGKLIDVDSYRGKYVLLEFWSSTCGACRVESPHLISAVNKYRKNGFDILGISLDDENFNGRERWLKAIEKDRTHIWEQVSDLKGHDSPVAVMYDVHAIPQNFLVNPEGIIIAKNLKGADLHQWLEKIFGDK